MTLFFHLDSFLIHIAGGGTKGVVSGNGEVGTSGKIINGKNGTNANGNSVGGSVD
jgi:hypothetical protein